MLLKIYTEKIANLLIVFNILNIIYYKFNMDNKVQDSFLAEWLKYAYIMENKIVSVLTKHAEDAKNFPEVQERIQQHMEETQNHVEMIKGCLEEMNSDLPEAKADLSQAFANIMEMFGTKTEQHELIKNSILEYSTENMEIAVYNTIITIAQQSNNERVTEVCTNIITEEQEMAEWIEDNMPDLVVEMYDEQMQTDEVGDSGEITPPEDQS